MASEPMNVVNHPALGPMVEAVFDHVSRRIAEAPPPPHDPNMDERIARLEGAHDGVKQSQNILVMSVMGLAALVVAVAAIVVTLQIQTKSEVGAVAAKVDALPESIGSAVRESNRAFSDALGAAIQATRQQAPAVIVLPPGSQPIPPGQSPK